VRLIAGWRSTESVIALSQIAKGGFEASRDALPL
jgi:hypothetical protein